MGKEKQDFIIRPMLDKDIAGVAAVESASFPAPWSESIFAYEMTNPLANYLVLEHKRGIIGYSGYWLVLGEAQVTNIALYKNFRGQGLGRKLVTALMQKAQMDGAENILLEVRRSNSVAQKLYESLGFRLIGERKGYYQDNGEDAFLMQKDFGEQNE